MGTKSLKIGLLITATLFILGSGCGKDNGSKLCRGGRYSFSATSEFSPQREVYNIGDTIFLTSTIPKILYDNVSLQNVNYSNSTGIGGDVGIALPDLLIAQNKPAKDSFEFISIRGMFVPRPINQNQGINIQYIGTTDYNFKGGIICKKKGVYAISVDNLLSRGLIGKDCTNGSFNMLVTNNNKHINLYQSILGITLDQYSIDRIYCFKVQ